MKFTAKDLLSPIAILATSLAIMFLLMSMKSSPKRKAQENTKIFVATQEVTNSPIQITVPVIGKISALQKITLFAEVSGVLLQSDHDFLTGANFEKGAVILSINNEESALNLKAQRSNLMTAIASLLPELKFDYPESYVRWENYLKAFDINSDTNPLPEPLNERESYFVANKGIARTYYDIKASETRLDKYSIRAPFNGTVIESTIKPGTLVRGGQTLGTFINPDKYDMETTVGINEITHISIGDQVKLSNSNMETSWMGVVSRISNGLDPNSQMVKVYVTVSGKGLREGMYLEGEILTSSTLDAVIIPRRLLDANRTVLEVKEGKINRLPVTVVSTRGEEAIVTGISNGTLLSLRTQNLQNGTSVSTIPTPSNNSSSNSEIGG